MAYQLLDMALLRKDEMKDSNCSVKELFAKSEKAMYMRASEKKIRLTYVFSQNYIVRGNLEQLLILINNLIDNAIKASQQEDEIRISAYSEESAIVMIRQEVVPLAGQGLGLLSVKELYRFTMQICHLFLNRESEQS